MRTLIAPLTVLLLTAATTRAGDAPARAAATAEKITFNKHIAPLVYASCTSCHRPNGGGPFSLISYADVRKRDTQIAMVTKDRYMPPWKPEPDFGKFAHDARLTDAQIDLFQRWADDGSLEGDARDLPKAPVYTDAWHLGPPDLIVTMTDAYNVPAEGRDINRAFVIPLEIPAGKYIRGIEFQPENKKVVHHAIFYMDTQQQGRKQDAQDPEPGFKAVGGALAGALPGPAGGWVPGQEAMLLPEGYALEWTKGADLLLQLHFKTSGKPEKERSRIGIYLTSEAPKYRLRTAPIIQFKIDILPGDAAYRVKQTFAIPADMDVYGMLPHMHNLGREIKATVKCPDGSVQPLIWIKDWDFNWQMYYQYAKPLRFPPGSVAEVEWTFDNSTANAKNPSNPPRRVHFGEQTADEMALLFLTLATRGPAAPGTKPVKPPVETEQEAFIRLDKNTNQHLSAEELTATGAPLAQTKKWIQTFDKDGDGELSVEEAAALKRGK